MIPRRMESDPIDSAGPALRGFRLQILYTLSRLIEPQTALSGQHIWPEGIEDVAILDVDGSPREAVQVKGYGASLRLSDMKLTLKRAVKIAQEHADCAICILSFGPIGPELTNAWAGEGSARSKVATKLKRMGLSLSEIELLFCRLELCEEREQDITEKIQRFLGAYPLLCGESAHASAILCQWLYEAAERRDQITHADLIKRLALIGRYLHARSGYWRDWASVIEPLDPESTPSQPSERLRDQFQQGMSTRYEHILADCDIRRHRWLERISAGFEKASVVIVHGASGQGKSALAYRWLHMETPSSWRLQIKLVENRREALQIAATLSSHAQAIGAPIAIYVDVGPQDQSWTLLVEELARIPQIRLLVTVREEEWRRATLSRADVEFEDISLSLDRAEAQGIYDQLARPETPGQFLSFEEAWSRFLGGKDGEGPLMEFVYLVHQSESLRDKLSAQVKRIRTEIYRVDGSIAELRLLALVAFASAHGGRLEIAPLRKRFPEIDLGFLVERFEREYLIRSLEQGLLLDGLHPVRSRLITEIILNDGINFDVLELAQECLELIPDSDVEIFLLHLGSRHAQAMPGMAAYIAGWRPPTWQAFGAVLRALLWWGVQQYVDRIAGMVKEIRGQHGSAWKMMLDLDLAELNPPHGTAVWKDLDAIPAERKAQMQSILDRQPPKHWATAPARDWLSKRVDSPRPPTTHADWAAIAEMSYWVGRWEIHGHIRDSLTAVDLNLVPEELDLRMIADLVRGCWELDNSRITAWLERYRDGIVERFRRETDTPWIEDRNGIVRAHFLVSWSDSTKDTEPSSDGDEEHKDRLHTEAIKRIELLRGIYPERAGYGSQGYGHQILFPFDHDSTTNTSIKPSGIPPHWGVHLNGICGALIEQRLRPDDWHQYLSDLWSVREAIASTMRDLRRVLIVHFKDRHKCKRLADRLNLAKWTSLQQTLIQAPLLPRQAVDEWGFVSEMQQGYSRQKSTSNLQRGFAISPYRRFLDYRSDLFRGLGNFLKQSQPYAFIECAEGESGAQLSRAPIEAKLGELGGKLSPERLTQLNLTDANAALIGFQREFRRFFSARMPAETLDDQDRRESQSFRDLTALWIAYLEQPTAHWENPKKRSTARFMGKVLEIPKHLERQLRALETQGIHCSLMAKPASWNEAPALWIRMDSATPEHMLTAISLAHPLLRQGVREAGLSEPQNRALERQWEHVVILSTFKGRSLDRQVRVMPIFRLTLDESSSELRWMDQIWRPVTDEDWLATGVSCWDTVEIAAAKRFVEAIGLFKAMIDHLSDWLSLSEIDGIDGKVMQSYIARSQPQWSTVVQTFIDGCASVASSFNALAEDAHEQRPYLAHAATALCDHYHQLLPPGLGQEEGTELSTATCRDWVDAVLSRRAVLDTLSAAFVIDALNEAQLWA